MISNGGCVDRRIFLIGAAAAAAGCATNPVTGRGQLILIDDSQLQSAALQAWDQQIHTERTWNNPDAQMRLQRIGMRIVTVARLGTQQWEFRLFDSDEKNAFVLPANKVGFYRGLYEFCQSDDEIACILGHETGHVLGRHAAERYSRNLATEVAVDAAAISSRNALAAAALGLGAQFGLVLPFSRDQEAEADMIGIELMHAAGYDVRQAIPFWRRMETSGGSRPPEFFSTHPGPETRIALLRQHINERGWGPV